MGSIRSPILSGLAVSLALFAVQVRATESNDGIENLLRESQNTLMGNGLSIDEPPPPRKQPRFSREKEFPKESPVISRAPDPTLEMTGSSEVLPIDTTAIQNVIAIDLSASQRDREPRYPVAKINISLGSHWLSPSYSLMKDDDHFYNDQGGGLLPEISLFFEPTWKLGFLQTTGVLPMLSAVFGAGYSQGAMTLRRSGIQPSVRSYGIKLFSVDIGAKLSAEISRRFLVFVGCGMGGEGFHQDGISVHDTTTQLFYGAEFWLGAGYKFGPSFDLILTYKRKGSLFLQPAFSGELLTAGFAFSLSG